MPNTEKNTFALPAYPTVAEVDRIAGQTEPVIRNLQITQCYYELSAAFATRTGPGANWCTFATWASKQAGQTIRREDLPDTLEALLEKEPGVRQAMSLIAMLCKQLGAGQSMEHIRKSALGSLISSSLARAGDAVSRGNKKVFEEIAREFARFMSACFNDKVYTPATIEGFTRQLTPGTPPNGQEYLVRAFSRYYNSFFEEDPRQRAEFRLLANLEIGFHEQTRLQPEIAESLNAAMIDPGQLKNCLLETLFANTAHHLRFGAFYQDILRHTSLLDEAVKLLLLGAQHHLRAALTEHLMRLTLPPDNCLRLGQDLAAEYPESLAKLVNEDILIFLAQVDPTPDSLLQSGATDWGSLSERLHFIADLFRCYHERIELFDPPFTPDQVLSLRAGRVPEGRL